VTSSLKPALLGHKRRAHTAVTMLALIGLGIGLAVFAGRTQTDLFPAETAALQSLIDDVKLEEELDLTAVGKGNGRRPTAMG
jgi:hypothetical protein